MKRKNQLKIWIILGIYVIATCSLLLLGYSIRKPAVVNQEFPYTITYSLDGKTETISDVFVVEYVRAEKYIGDNAINWFGYIKDHDRLEYNYYTIAEGEGPTYSINLNLESGYLMGDPSYADSASSPELVILSFDGTNEIRIDDPEEAKEMGFYLVSYEYPEPIENSFGFGGISMSSQSVMLTSAIAVVALLACMIAIKKDKELTYGVVDKLAILLNFVVMIFAFPFILVSGCLMEIISDASFLYQVLYIIPALTAIGVAISVTARRMGYKWLSFLVQFAAPVVFGLIILLENF